MKGKIEQRDNREIGASTTAYPKVLTYLGYPSCSILGAVKRRGNRERNPDVKKRTNPQRRESEMRGAVGGAAGRWRSKKVRYKAKALAVMTKDAVGW